jgi:adenine-specific DNA-methyltransferase
MSYSKLSDESPEARSSSPVTDHIDQLAILFPSVVREGKVDFEALKELLGEHVAKDGELFGLEWKGKAEARHWATVQSLGTLRPCREDSVDWEHTKNLYIEGDNLEVLKLLRKSYVGKVKVIYIDPPYNTGKDFVYADDYRNGIEEYKQLTGQNGVFSANQETSGSYHTAWLNMMYPRLLLAKDLLREDGVIFISIDDTECADLRKICEEIFGEVNFLAQIVWERAYSPINLMKHFSPAHDYIVCFAKNEALAQCNGLKRSSTANDRYSNPDNDPRGSWKPSDLSVGPAVEENIYPITTPSGRVVEPPAGRSWSLSKKAFLERLQDNRIWFGPQGNSVPSMKRFLTELRKEGITPMTYWRYDEVGHSQDATKKLAEIFDGKKIFLYPKPVNLIKRCISLYAGPNDLVLDFFSGSSTTGHSVLELNVERENSGGGKIHPSAVTRAL